MSLDVSLIMKEKQVRKPSSGIFVRENGETKEITLGEWIVRNPSKPYPQVKFEQEEVETNEVYSANITHNLNTMATEAGIYEYLWRPDEIGVTHATELIEPLRQGLHKLKSEPEKYKKFNPDNGWGTYEGLIRFVENYLNACYEYPNATIEVDR